MNEIADDIIKPQGGKRKPLPPIEFLRECFEYFPDTGKLIWKRRPIGHFEKWWASKAWNSRWPGKEAGSRQFRVNGDPLGIIVGVGEFSIYAHNIAFTMNFGEIPDGFEVDHIDNHPFNNRASNLRTGTHQQNSCNRGANRNKKSGTPVGVYPFRGKFRAYVRVHGKLHYGGDFPDIASAVAAREILAKRLHGDFSWDKDKTKKVLPPT